MDKVASRLKRVVTKNVIQFEAANLAKFADGSCLCTLGDTSVLVTVVSKPSQRASSGFLPLTVDYKQKAAAAGRIPMTHLRRDIGFTEKEVLTGRMIDRSVRPSFPKGYNVETQIVCNLLAADGHNEPDILAINGASASLAMSDIPWTGPIGAVRMGFIGDNLIVNPTRLELVNSRLNLVVAANSIGNFVMLDGSCREPMLITDICKALRASTKECIAVIDSIMKLQRTFGRPKRELINTDKPTSDQIEFLMMLCRGNVHNILSNHTFDKTSRDEAMQCVRERIVQRFNEKFPNARSNVFDHAFSRIVRIVYKSILNRSQIRCDGRKFDDIRPISCQVDLYKPLHGSALFQRGQTQVFCSTTIDSVETAYRPDPLSLLTSGMKDKNFMLHYEFPPFATNEIGRVAAAPGRREIGHGALAEKALSPLVPDQNEMTIRLNCEVLESNGSSSMASVCAGSMSLMDASIDFREHVAGVSIGLISDLDEQELYLDKPNKKKLDSLPKESYNMLTDILGFEDYIGDMDFKIAGTRKGVTAVQLDVKPVVGIPNWVIYKGVQKAHSAKEKIIQLMGKAIPGPRKRKKSNHPVTKTIYIAPQKRSQFIGFGGANLKKLTAQIGVRVTILDDGQTGELIAKKEDDKTGNVRIFAPNMDAMEEAEEFIESILEKSYVPNVELDFNGIYTATIEEIRPNGVMVSLYTNMTPTLLPLSQLDIKTVKHPSALKLVPGQQIQVKYFGRDPATGQIRLSRKSLQMSSLPRTRNLTETK